MHLNKCYKYISFCLYVNMFHSWQFILVFSGSFPIYVPVSRALTIDLVTAFKLQVNSSLYNTKLSLVDILLMINRQNKHTRVLRVTRSLFRTLVRGLVELPNANEPQTRKCL